MGIVYVLKLQHGKYYIGYTNARDLRARMYRHNRGYGSSWTNKHKPLEIVQIIQNANMIKEKEITIQYMKKYGYQNVRGYVWSSSYPIEKPRDV